MLVTSLIDSADEREMFDFSNTVRAMRPVYHLLKRVEADQRSDVLKSASSSRRRRCHPVGIS